MIHVVMVTYNNARQTRTRWERDLLPGLELFGMPYRPTVVDNSSEESGDLRSLFGPDYLWQNGANLMYGPSINLAVPRFPSQYILYVCSRHGWARDPSWVGDMIRPMTEEPRIGMTGFLMGSNSPEGVAHDLKAPWIAERFRFDDGVREHIQGGVFAARTQLMLRFPYPPDVTHNYTDHVLTWSFLKAGFLCVTVSSVKSVWRDRIYHRDQYKYLHSEDPECLQ